jgi:hypothetical protein
MVYPQRSSLRTRIQTRGCTLCAPEHDDGGASRAAAATNEKHPLISHGIRKLYLDPYVRRLSQAGSSDGEGRGMFVALECRHPGVRHCAIRVDVRRGMPASVFPCPLNASSWQKLACPTEESCCTALLSNPSSEAIDDRICVLLTRDRPLDDSDVHSNSRRFRRVL